MCESSSTLMFASSSASFAIGGLPRLFFLVVRDTAGADAFGERIEHRDGLLPANAAVGDAQSVHELLPGHQILPTAFQVAFDHDAEDALVASGHLCRHV